MGIGKKQADIKLVALDMDGTLLNDQGEISEENRLAIKEAQGKGVKIVLSTGRSLKTSQDHADSLDLSSYIVTVNGGEIWDAKRQLVKRTLLRAESIEWFWKLAMEHKSKFWAISSKRNFHNEMPDDIFTFEWLKFGFYSDDHGQREAIRKKLMVKGEFEISSSSLRNIEVNPLGVNKANGLRSVCALYGFDMKHVLAIGDSMNDLAMIQEAGLGVAMGNAEEHIKQAADWVTTTNEQNGVANAIRRLVL